MAELNNAAFTGSGNPQITYKVTYGVRSDGGYGFTITCSLSSSGSFLGTGYGLQAVITCGTYSVTIPLKATTDSWRGSGVKATKTGTLYAGWSTSARAVTFRVDRTDSLGGHCWYSEYTVWLHNYCQLDYDFADSPNYRNFNTFF